jgi:hypothetical protein
MSNKQELVKWLEHSYFKTNEQIREFTQWGDTELYQSQISMLEFRKEWLELQINLLNNRK